MAIVIHTIGRNQYAYEHHRVGNTVQSDYLGRAGGSGINYAGSKTYGDDKITQQPNIQTQKPVVKEEITQQINKPKVKNLSDAEIEYQLSGKPIKNTHPKLSKEGYKYTVNWNTKASGLKYKDYTDKEKAWKAWRAHSNQDSIMWKEDKDGYQDNFRVSWLQKCGDMKTEEDVKEEFYKFIDNK